MQDIKINRDEMRRLTKNRAARIYVDGGDIVTLGFDSKGRHIVKKTTNGVVDWKRGRVEVIVMSDDEAEEEGYPVKEPKQRLTKEEKAVLRAAVKHFEWAKCNGVNDQIHTALKLNNATASYMNSRR